jgi:hypothetical protein
MPKLNLQMFKSILLIGWQVAERKCQLSVKENIVFCFNPCRSYWQISSKMTSLQKMASFDNYLRSQSESIGVLVRNWSFSGHFVVLQDLRQEIKPRREYKCFMLSCRFSSVSKCDK